MGERCMRGSWEKISPWEEQEPVMGIEPATHALRKHCSTAELHRPVYRGVSYSSDVNDYTLHGIHCQALSWPFYSIRRRINYNLSNLRISEYCHEAAPNKTEDVKNWR